MLYRSSVRVISMNLNGIRSAAKKGFFEWLAKQRADVVCLQETRADMENITREAFEINGFHTYFFDAEKKGYSGVGIYTRREPRNVVMGLGFECADREGRYIQIDFEHLSIASLYMPSGSSGEARQAVKYDFMARYMSLLKKIRQKRNREFIICGDWNIVHKRIDIKNWTSNQKNSGCLPEERQWLDDVITKAGFVDAFRVLNQEPDQYTWWSHRGRAWDNNVGWRIDYQMVTPGLRNKIKAVRIFRDEKFSDHAPLIVDYNIKL